MRLTNELRDKIVQKETAKKFSEINKQLDKRIAQIAESMIAKRSNELLKKVLDQASKNYFPNGIKTLANYEIQTVVNSLIHHGVLSESSFCIINRKVIHAYHKESKRGISVSLPNSYLLKSLQQSHTIEIEVFSDGDGNETVVKNIEDATLYDVLKEFDDSKKEEIEFIKTLNGLLNRFTTSNALIKAIPEMEIHFIGLEKKPKMELLPISLIQDIRASLVRP
jgi:hypothetical protein